MASSSTGAASAAAVAAGEGPPDLLLDADRLHMLLDVICMDYLTASYASRENGKRVVNKALRKLALSVYASAPGGAGDSGGPRINVHDAAFDERTRVFYDELQQEVARRRHQQREEHAQQQQQQQQQQRHSAVPSSLAALTTSSGLPLVSPSIPVAEENLLKEALKPKLLMFVEDLCKERDRLLRGSGPPSSQRGTTVTPGSTHSGSMNMSSSHIPTTTTASAALLGPPSSTATPAAATAAAAIAALPAGGLPSTWQSGEIRMEGWLRKKGQHVNLWRDRYFMIRSTPDGAHYLCYFRRKGDKEPRGWYLLGPGTTVDEVRESPSKIETKPLFTFRIRHLTHASAEDVDDSMGASTLADHHQTPGSSSTNLLLTPSRSTTSYDFPMSPDTAGSGTDYDYDPRASTKKANSRKFRSRAAAAAAAATAATAVVLTGGLAGVGIGMGMGMSAAAAASAGAAGAIMVQNRNKGPIALAAESLETAIWWRNSIVECIAQAEEQWKRYLNWYMDKDNEFQNESAAGRDDDSTAAESTQPVHPNSPSQVVVAARAGASYSLVKPPSCLGSSSSKSLRGSGRIRSGSFGTIPRSIAKTFRTSATFSQETSWTLYEYSSKIRVDVERSQLHSSVVAKNGPPPALRTSIKVMASPKRVFELLMDVESSFYTLNHVITEARILEDNAEDHSDVVYWKLAPAFIWPFYAETRDLCLLRYWRKEQDSSYFICFQSTTHPKCPASRANNVRASMMGGGFIISPRVHADDHFEECWVTFTLQMNPKGWIDTSLARSCYYMHAYGARILEMVTALTAPVNANATPRPAHPSSAVPGDPALSSTGSTSQLIVSESLYPMLEPFRTDLSLKNPLPPKFWSEPDASGFFVRGPHYMSTQAKIRSKSQAFRLFGVELLNSAHDRITNVGLSSVDPLGLGAKDETQPLIFVVNFMLPGPPHHSLVLYFTPGDPDELKKNSAFADLCHSFFHGASDEYRTKRLKLIPRIVQGTWSIREGVGSTPAIVGTKVHNKYYQGRQYLEVDYDIGSSTVASGIVKMILGYARDLVIDLAFVIEAQSSLELPERVLGCVRLDCIDLRHATVYDGRLNNRCDRK